MANRGFSLRVLLAQAIPFFAAQTLAQGGESDAESDILKYIDPFIGTLNGGHVFPGASLPFGMAKAVADTNGGDGQGGFASNDGDSKRETIPSIRNFEILG